MSTFIDDMEKLKVDDVKPFTELHDFKLPVIGGNEIKYPSSKEVYGYDEEENPVEIDKMKECWSPVPNGTFTVRQEGKSDEKTNEMSPSRSDVSEFKFTHISSSLFFFFCIHHPLLMQLIMKVTLKLEKRRHRNHPHTLLFGRPCFLINQTFYIYQKD